MRIAIITARGGSKRIPHKNIKEFCGKPILAYSIEAALVSGLFDKVMVSTDSEEIAQTAIRYGASVPFLRSEKTSDDYATTADVIKEVLAQYKEKGRSFDMFCCLYPTAPFVTGPKLKAAMEAFLQSNADSLMTVVKFSYPPQRGLIQREGMLRYQYPEYERARSQDLEPIYHDCGQFYFCRTAAFEKYGTLVTPRTAPFAVPEEEVQDIDSPSDWILAELKYRALRTRQEL